MFGINNNHINVDWNLMIELVTPQNESMNITDGQNLDNYISGLILIKPYMEFKSQ